MKVIIFCKASNNHQMPCAEAFKKGLEKHKVNVEFNLTHGFTPKQTDADLVVFWGDSKTGLIKCQKERGKDYLIMERGYFGDRMKNYSLSFNGLNGRGEMYNRGCPSDRWEPHKDLMKPWRGSKGEYILLMGQMPGDRTHSDLIDIRAWYPKITKELEKVFKLPVIFRPHPEDSRYNNIRKIKLSEQLNDAYCVATFNSNSAVDSILAGIPTICFERTSMAYPVCINYLNHIDKLNEEPDRQTWANNLAYCQWTKEEIEAGLAWEHLKQRYA